MKEYRYRSVPATIAPNAPTLPLEYVESKYKSQEYAKPEKNLLFYLVTDHLNGSTIKII